MGNSRLRNLNHPCLVNQCRTVIMSLLHSKCSFLMSIKTVPLLQRLKLSFSRHWWKFKSGRPLRPSAAGHPLNTKKHKTNPFGAGKCGDAQHLQMKQCTALLCFLLAACEAWLLHWNQESLIHTGLRGKEKLLEQSPFLEPVVKSSDQSTLSPWASWGLGTQASVLQWHQYTEDEEAEGGKGMSRRCGNCDRDSLNLQG